MPCVCPYQGRLDRFGDYTFRTWGIDQTILYIDSIEAFFHQLADYPELGRACDYILPKLRRLEHRSHVVFYQVEPGGVAIIRVLHKRMLPEKQVIEELEQ